MPLQDPELIKNYECPMHSEYIPNDENVGFIYMGTNDTISNIQINSLKLLQLLIRMHT